jgi:CHAT domain-containing protein
MRTAASTLLAAIALVVCAIPFGQIAEQDPVAEALVELSYRPSVARLSGALRHRPYKRSLRPDLAIELIADVDEHPPASRLEHVHALGVSRLIGGDHAGAARVLGEAVTLVERMPVGPERRAAILNDFAVAQYEAAPAEAKRLIIALDAIQKAWSLDRTPATAWTRAVLLSSLVSKATASAAWNDYLALDSTSSWAREVLRLRRNASTRDLDLEVKPASLIVSGSIAVKGGSAAIEQYDRELEQRMHAGDRNGTVSVLLRRAATLDSMRATDEAWPDRLKARTLVSGALTEQVIETLAVAAIRDGYVHAAHALFSDAEQSARRRQDEAALERAIKWRGFAAARLKPNAATLLPCVGDPAGVRVSELARAVAGCVPAGAAIMRHEHDGQIARGLMITEGAIELTSSAMSPFRLVNAVERLRVNRRGVTHVTQRSPTHELYQFATLASSLFPAAIFLVQGQASDQFETLDRDDPRVAAVEAMVAESVRSTFQKQAEIEGVNGAIAAALWLSDRARVIGRPAGESSPCGRNLEGQTVEQMGLQLARCVPNGVTLVHQDLDQENLHTWVIRDGNIDFTTTRVFAPRLIAEIEQFRGDIQRGVNEPALRRQAEHLYDVLLRLVQQEIAGTGLLVYSPSPNLRDVPVNALHDGQGFLLQRRLVTTTATVSSFELPRTPANTAAAFVVLPPVAPRGTRLAGAESEIKEVMRIYGSRASLLTGAAATPATFLDAVAAYDVVHIATHGQTSGIPYQNAIEFGTRKIRAYDVFQMQLDRAPVVMLAACRTADETGGPTNVSLAGAFLAAGASSVVGSLWDVEDDDTEELSVAFHRELARGVTPQDALRNVQLQFIRLGKPVSAWAAFQVSS